MELIPFDNLPTEVWDHVWPYLKLHEIARFVILTGSRQLRTKFEQHNCPPDQLATSKEEIPHTNVQWLSNVRRLGSMRIIASSAEYVKAPILGGLTQLTVHAIVLQTWSTRLFEEVFLQFHPSVSSLRSSCNLVNKIMGGRGGFHLRDSFPSLQSLSIIIDTSLELRFLAVLNNAPTTLKHLHILNTTNPTNFEKLLYTCTDIILPPNLLDQLETLSVQNVFPVTYLPSIPNLVLMNEAPGHWSTFIDGPLNLSNLKRFGCDATFLPSIAMLATSASSLEHFGLLSYPGFSKEINSILSTLSTSHVNQPLTVDLFSYANQMESDGALLQSHGFKVNDHCDAVYLRHMKNMIVVLTAQLTHKGDIVKDKAISTSHCKLHIPIDPKHLIGEGYWKTDASVQHLTVTGRKPSSFMLSAVPSLNPDHQLHLPHFTDMISDSIRSLDLNGFGVQFTDIFHMAQHCQVVSFKCGLIILDTEAFALPGLDRRLPSRCTRQSLVEIVKQMMARPSKRIFAARFKDYITSNLQYDNVRLIANQLRTNFGGNPYENVIHMNDNVFVSDTHFDSQIEHAKRVEHLQLDKCASSFFDTGSLMQLASQTFPNALVKLEITWSPPNKATLPVVFELPSTIEDIYAPWLIWCVDGNQPLQALKVKMPLTDVVQDSAASAIHELTRGYKRLRCLVMNQILPQMCITAMASLELFESVTTTQHLDAINLSLPSDLIQHLAGEETRQRASLCALQQSKARNVGVLTLPGLFSTYVVKENLPLICNRCKRSYSEITPSFEHV